MVSETSELVESGIKWPSLIKVSEFHTPITQEDRPSDDKFVSGYYNLDPPSLIYSEKADPRVRDALICHELVHLMEHQVLAHEPEFSEVETQAIANFLHSLLVQILKANGVEVYESSMEISRTKGIREITGSGREVAESMAVCDDDRQDRSSGSAGS